MVFNMPATSDIQKDLQTDNLTYLQDGTILAKEYIGVIGISLCLKVRFRTQRQFTPIFLTIKMAEFHFVTKGS